jgi:hypothetical protein
MRVRCGGRRSGGILLAFYALVVAASPLLHHDFDCHLKSRTHCGACTANPLAPGAEPRRSEGALRLPETGRVEAVRRPLPKPADPVRLPARSPPA